PLINHPAPHILPPLPPNLQPPVSMASSNPPPVMLNKSLDQERPDNMNNLNNMNNMNSLNNGNQQPPALPINNKLNNNSISPWISGAPPLQPPFNDMFEPNLLINQLPPM